MDARFVFSPTLSFPYCLVLPPSCWRRWLGVVPGSADPIHDAAEQGDLAKVTALIDPNPHLVFSKDEDGRYALAPGGARRAAGHCGTCCCRAGPTSMPKTATATRLCTWPRAWATGTCGVAAGPRSRCERQGPGRLYAFAYGGHRRPRGSCPGCCWTIRPTSMPRTRMAIRPCIWRRARAQRKLCSFCWSTRPKPISETTTATPPLHLAAANNQQEVAGAAGRSQAHKSMPETTRTTRPCTSRSRRATRAWLHFCAPRRSQRRLGDGGIAGRGRVLLHARARSAAPVFPPRIRIVV